MVAIPLPKSWLILLHELDAAQPFGAFPEIEMWYNHPHWRSMIWRQQHAVMPDAEEGCLQQEVRERKIRRPPMLGMQHHMGSFWLQFHLAHQFRHSNAFPHIVQL
ncbi:hypothetical protein D3C85_1245390 [compost metagenome]